MIDQWSISMRPKNLDDVAGCGTLKKLIRSSVAEDNWPRAFLLTGKFGTGKTTIAKIIAQSMVCKHLDEQGNPCGTCKDCLSVINETYTRDVKHIAAETIKKGDNGSSSVVEFVKILAEDAKARPMFGDKKVIIFEEIQQLFANSDKQNAVNALLSLLESPTSRTYWIFTSMENLPTNGFTSRCTRFNFNECSVADILKYLYTTSKKIIYEDQPLLQYLLNEPGAGEQFCKEGLLEIAKASDYSYREALKILQQCVRTKTYNPESIRALFGAMSEDNVLDCLKLIAKGVKDDRVLQLLAQVDSMNYMQLFYIGSMMIRDAITVQHFGKLIKKTTVKEGEEDEALAFKTLTQGTFEVNQATDLLKAPNFMKLKAAFETFAKSELRTKDTLITYLLECYNT